VAVKVEASVLKVKAVVKVKVKAAIKVKRAIDMIEMMEVLCVLAKDVKVNKLGVWLPGRLLNVSLMMCKEIKAYL
jgi:hypothetical protein